MTDRSSPAPTVDARTAGRRRVWIERADQPVEDWLVVEEPLEIRINGRPFAITMRTPGNDEQLAAGFLYGEGVVRKRQDVEEIRVEEVEVELGIAEEGRSQSDHRSRAHRVLVELSEEAFDRWAARRVERELVATSACGVCGKPSLDDLWQECTPVQTVDWDRRRISELIVRMSASQKIFGDTGGAHGAALFRPTGERLVTFEDVGRHNAVDKVVGSRLLEAGETLAGLLLVTSGRAGFEIVQKAIVGRAAALIAVGAASSLAVDLAARAGLEMISFAGRALGNRHLYS